MSAKTARPSGTKSRRRASANGETVQGYFRPIFNENPKLLKRRSNKELYKRWLADHPGTSEVPQNVMQGLSVLKSMMRRRRTVRRKLRGESANKSGSAVTTSGLVRLEALVDDALAFAKHIDREGLEDIIRLLHAARNKVVVRLG
jgi:hypothetical protein